MHYYQFNIGDYASHTSHLTETEDLAYRRMLDYCYLNECGLPESVERIARVIRMPQHCHSIATVLLEYFTQHTDGTYRQVRIDKEIEAYKGKSKDASDKANKRWKKGDAVAMPMQCQSNAKQETLNIKQEPINIQDTAPAKAVAVISKKPNFDLMESVPDLCQQVAEDFIAVRKSKKSPMTATALALITKEADKAGITTAQAIAIAAGRGWQSFKAEWISQDKTFAEKEQDYKDEQAKKHYRTLLTMTDDEKKAWGFQ